MPEPLAGSEHTQGTPKGQFRGSAPPVLEGTADDPADRIRAIEVMVRYGSDRSGR